MATETKSRFSAGLQFSLEKLQTSRDAAVEDDAGSGTTPSLVAAPPSLTEEEHLLRRALELRQRMSTDLQPRIDALDEAFRVLHRDAAALRRHLPSSAFLHFHSTCAALHRRLLLFEETTVQRVVKDAVEAAVGAGECAVTDAARWRKSNRRPLLSTFVGLLVLVTLTNAQNSADLRGVTVRDNNCSFPIAIAAADPVREAVHRHVALLWAAKRHSELSDAFLDRFYQLKDALFGWGRGWHPLPTCSAGATAGDKGQADSCPSSAWETLAPLDQLNSFSSLCPQHLTETVVASLEAAVASVFADVWAAVAAVA